VRVWDVRRSELTQILREPTSWISSVVFSPNSTLLASSVRDQTVTLLNSYGYYDDSVPGYTIPNGSAEVFARAGYRAKLERDGVLLAPLVGALGSCGAQALLQSAQAYACWTAR
jgi:hypothetical protein